MMAIEELQASFERAAEEVKSLTQRPDNGTLLKLYALYKQAASGDVSGKRPGFADPVGKAKYDAWSKLKGMPAGSAMEAYIALVEKLQA